MSQSLGLSTFTAVALGSIPGQGTKIPQAVRYGQKNVYRNINYVKYILLLPHILYN